MSLFSFYIYTQHYILSILTDKMRSLGLKAHLKVVFEFSLRR